MKQLTNTVTPESVPGTARTPAPINSEPRTPFWWATIDEAEARGEFTEGEVARASGWVTCACGRQDPRIKRNSVGAPVDGVLIHLGCMFYSHVASNRYASARQTLSAIERRSAELIAESEPWPVSEPITQ